MPVENDGMVIMLFEPTYFYAPVKWLNDKQAWIAVGIDLCLCRDCCWNWPMFMQGLLLELTYVYAGIAVGIDLCLCRDRCWNWPMFMQESLLELTYVYAGIAVGIDLCLCRDCCWNWPMFMQGSLLELTYVYAGIAVGIDLCLCSCYDVWIDQSSVFYFMSFHRKVIKTPTQKSVLYICNLNKMYLSKSH